MGEGRREGTEAWEDWGGCLGHSELQLEGAEGGRFTTRGASMPPGLSYSHNFQILCQNAIFQQL
jgi:hypothetical protein